MTLVELRYLVALGQAGHFGRAAERCRVSQPTLSMAIRSLEQDLGVLLFERSKSGIKATQMGEQIIAQAQRVVAQADAINALAEADKDQLGGEFRLGAIFSLGPQLLPQLVPQLRLIAAGLRLSMSEGYTRDLGAKLSSGELDAIMIAQPFAATDVVTQELYKEPLVAIMPPNHPLAGKQLLAAEDFAGHNFIQLQQEHCLRAQIEAWAPGLSHQANILEGSSLETLRHMVGIGLGVSVVPSSAAVPALTHQQFVVRSLRFSPNRSVALAWRASFPRHKAIDALRRAINICSWQFTTARDSQTSGLLVENQSW